MKFFHQSLAKKQVLRQIKCFGGRFSGRDVGFKKRVAILGPVNFRSMIRQPTEVSESDYSIALSRMPKTLKGLNAFEA